MDVKTVNALAEKYHIADEAIPSLAKKAGLSLSSVGRSKVVCFVNAQDVEAFERQVQEYKTRGKGRGSSPDNLDNMQKNRTHSLLKRQTEALERCVVLLEDQNRILLESKTRP